MKPYPAYKDSGVEWLGQVPEGWEVVPIKRRFFVRLGKMLQPASKAEGDFEAPYLRAANIHWRGVDLTDIKTMWFSSSETETLDLRRGDLLVSEGGDVGRSALLEGDLEGVYFQNSVNRVRPRANDSTKFLYYWMAAIKESGYVDVLCNKSTIAHFTAEKVEAVPVPLPPLPEQQAIAAFLDRETAKIDGLIEQQRRLIALLAEKRQATISHAVTRGLNPSARLKPSGVDWLGDIPEGWEVRRLKFFISEIKAGPFGSALTKDMYSDSGYRVYGQEQVIPADFTVGDYYIPANVFQSLSNYEVEPGDVLISCVGTFGRIAVVPENIEPGIINPRLMRLRCKEEIIPEYLATVLKSPVVSRQFEFLSRGGTMDVINVGTLQEIWIAAPVIDLQREILDMLAKTTAQLDALAETATSAIALLQERRAALISAAVTGKIDVRDLAAVRDAA